MEIVAPSAVKGSRMFLILFKINEDFLNFYTAIRYFFGSISLCNFLITITLLFIEYESPLFLLVSMNHVGNLCV